MKSLADAIEVARVHLIEMSEWRDYQFVLIESMTVESPHGWIFKANTSAYLETQDHLQYCPYNFIVSKVTGEVVQVGSAKPLEYYVEKFEASFR